MSAPVAAPVRTSVSDPDLRACIRDLVALSAMPSWWIGRSPDAIAESVRDLLLSALHVDAAYVRVRDPLNGKTQVAAVGITEKEVEEGQADRYLRLARWPLGLNGELGTLAVASSRPDFPTGLESLLLQVSANQAAITFRHSLLLVRHQRAEQQLRARAVQQATVTRLGLRILTGVPEDELLREVPDLVCDTLHGDYCEILELAPSRDSLLLVAGCGWRPGEVGKARVGAGLESHAGYTLSIADAVIVRDLSRETRFRGSPLHYDHDVVSGVAAIIHGPAVPYGVLGVHTRTSRQFTPDDVHFIQAMANLLSTALQRNVAEAEREALLEQAERAAAARDRAVSIVSHDLRNPVSTIQICATALLDSETPTLAGSRHMADIILRSTAWMQQIIQDLLDRASLDAGRLSLHKEPTPPWDVISAAQEMFEPVAQEQSLELLVDVGADLPLVDADSHRLLQALGNLLNNALKFTPAGGRVILSARAAAMDHPGLPPGPAVRFAVSDTGPGMPPEDVQHVFDWFWQAPRPGKSGAGLGLAIAKGLIEAHGGALKVESAPGKGSTFWFTVPAAMPRSAQVPATSSAPAA
ncbi:MAG: hypothetical protein QOH59_1504 [Gemmatimonadales bacterium]|jgi:signal transduction histidine kinase|nr:hypothetical protein [Gemmatimonadales bacterium]